jgi:hypothetical protein
VKPSRIAWPAATTILLVALISPDTISASAATSPPPVAAGPSGPSEVGGLGIQLLDVSTADALDPRGRLYITDHVAPGGSVHRRIQITNTTSQVVSVALYSAAATISDAVFTPAPARTPNDVSSWTSTTPATADLQAHNHTDGTVIIAVPADAAPGERCGVIWAQTTTQPAGHTGVTQISRVGIRASTSPSAPAPPPRPTSPSAPSPHNARQPDARKSSPPSTTPAAGP